MDTDRYHAWYETPRGVWIGHTELRPLLDLLRPEDGASLLELGCGSGWFSAGLAARELAVTGPDPDLQVLACRSQTVASSRPFLHGSPSVPFSPASCAGVPHSVVLPAHDTGALGATIGVRRP